MKLIAHRGNFAGRKEKWENYPEYLNAAMALGYDVECDAWFYDNQFYLGHDKPTFKTSIEYLMNNKIWIHAKTILTLANIVGLRLNGFYHQRDRCSLTTLGFIWTYPYKNVELTRRTIIVMPKEDYRDKLRLIAGICDDNVQQYVAERG